MAGPVSSEDVLKLFENLTVWKKGDQRAPHKPLLVLYSLARLEQGDRMVPYREADEHLRELLIDFGPPRKRHHPEYPFWRLQNDKVWVVEETECLKRRASNTDPLKSELKKYNVRAGFTDEIFDKLRSDDKLRQQIGWMLLTEHFPTSLHQDILSAVGLDLGVERLERRKRDPNFRARVLQAYSYRCAVCGYDLKLRRTILGLEAAHIKWHQAGGPDEEKNGLALCALHHKMLDKGAIHVDEDLTLLVSETVHGSDAHLDTLHARHGVSISQPQRSAYQPAPEFVKWHLNEVFRSPARPI